MRQVTAKFHGKILLGYEGTQPHEQVVAFSKELIKLGIVNEEGFQRMISDELAIGKPTLVLVIDNGAVVDHYPKEKFEVTSKQTPNDPLINDVIKALEQL